MKEKVLIYQPFVYVFTSCKKRRQRISISLLPRIVTDIKMVYLLKTEHQNSSSPEIERDLNT